MKKRSNENRLESWKIIKLFFLFKEYLKKERHLRELSIKANILAEKCMPWGLGIYFLQFDQKMSYVHVWGSF